MDWLNEIGIVCGIFSFYKSMIAVFLGYFIDIDYHVSVIKKLFLEEQTDEKFYNTYINMDEISKKKNCC